jgi:hypothetical protein
LQHPLTRISEIAKDKPSIDIEIKFDYNSDVVGPNALRALGRVLSNEQVTASTR